jgi:lantibiotic modifying enzyme
VVVPARPPERPWLDAARRAERWLASVAIRTEHGLTWAADPLTPTSVSTDLYHGASGVVLFFLELSRTTGEAGALSAASAGADHLAAWMKEVPASAPAGLYTGLAGVAYTLAMAARATGQPRHREAALLALTGIHTGAKPAGRGVQWNPSTDIISGSAGIGIFLLWAHQHLDDTRALDLATRAGRRLIDLGQPSRDGLKWLIQPRMPRNYPNFSHGTAGVSYFLATLYEATKEQEFLDAAQAGARYLDAIATSTTSGGRMVFHSEPGNESIYYMSWCHGPAGTARLYHRLARATGSTAHRDRVAQLARALEDMKVPERSPGFWNNISQCCGNSGVVEFLLDLHRSRGEPRWLDLAGRISADTLQRGTAESDAMRWIQAEHRVRPELLVAQTGLMQGAAGVGLAMLHLDGAVEGHEREIVLPDNPF